MLATTPTQKKGHTLSVNTSIHYTQKIEIVGSDHPTIPNFDIIITHSNWAGKVETIALDIFCETFAEVELVLVQMVKDCNHALATIRANKLTQ